MFLAVFEATLPPNQRVLNRIKIQTRLPKFLLPMWRIYIWRALRVKFEERRRCGATCLDGSAAMSASRLSRSGFLPLPRASPLAAFGEAAASLSKRCATCSRCTPRRIFWPTPALCACRHSSATARNSFTCGRHPSRRKYTMRGHEASCMPHTRASFSLSRASRRLRSPCDASHLVAPEAQVGGEVVIRH